MQELQYISHGGQAKGVGLHLSTYCSTQRTILPFCSPQWTQTEYQHCCQEYPCAKTGKNTVLNWISMIYTKGKIILINLQIAFISHFKSNPAQQLLMWSAIKDEYYSKTTTVTWVTGLYSKPCLIVSDKIWITYHVLPAGKTGAAIRPQRRLSTDNN